MTSRNRRRDRNTILWSAAYLITYTGVCGVIVHDVVVDPRHWVWQTVVAGSIWLVVAVVCSVLIEESVRSTRRRRLTVPADRLQHHGRLYHGQLRHTRRALGDVEFPGHAVGPAPRPVHVPAHAAPAAEPARVG